eukprot:UC4_evm5s335
MSTQLKRCADIANSRQDRCRRTRSVYRSGALRPPTPKSMGQISCHQAAVIFTSARSLAPIIEPSHLSRAERGKIRGGKLLSGLTQQNTRAHQSRLAQVPSWDDMGATGGDTISAVNVETECDEGTSASASSSHSSVTSLPRQHQPHSMFINFEPSRPDPLSDDNNFSSFKSRLFNLFTKRREVEKSFGAFYAERKALVEAIRSASITFLSNHVVCQTKVDNTQFLPCPSNKIGALFTSLSCSLENIFFHELNPNALGTPWNFLVEVNKDFVESNSTQYRNSQNGEDYVELCDDFLARVQNFEFDGQENNATELRRARCRIWIRLALSDRSSFISYALCHPLRQKWYNEVSILRFDDSLAEISGLLHPFMTSDELIVRPCPFDDFVGIRRNYSFVSTNRIAVQSKTEIPCSTNIDLDSKDPSSNSGLDMIYQFKYGTGADYAYEGKKKKRQQKKTTNIIDPSSDLNRLDDINSEGTANENSIYLSTENKYSNKCSKGYVVSMNINKMRRELTDLNRQLSNDKNLQLLVNNDDKGEGRTQSYQTAQDVSTNHSLSSSSRENSIDIIFPKGAPYGSYRDSCRDCKIVDGKICADLKCKDGYTWKKSFAFFSEDELFENIDGILTSTNNQEEEKNRLPPVPYEALPPISGSWICSCERYLLQGDILFAELRTKNGSIQNAYVEVELGASYENVDGKFQILKNTEHNQIKAVSTSDSENTFERAQSYGTTVRDQMISAWGDCPFDTNIDNGSPFSEASNEIGSKSEDDSIEADPNSSQEHKDTDIPNWQSIINMTHNAPLPELLEEEVWENQRRGIFARTGDYSADALWKFDPPPWSSEDFKKKKSKDTLLPRLGWQWHGEWVQDLRLQNVDSDGWMYASSFKGSFHSECLSNFCVRRRRWVRKVRPCDRVPIDEVLRRTEEDKMERNNTSSNSTPIYDLCNNLGLPIDDLVEFIGGFDNINGEDNGESESGECTPDNSENNPTLAYLSSSPEDEDVVDILSSRETSHSGMKMMYNNHKVMEMTSRLFEMSNMESIEEMEENDFSRYKYYKCWGCKSMGINTPIGKVASESEFLGFGRRCEFTGHLYCCPEDGNGCHQDDYSLIPARMISIGDFTVHPVCKATLEYFNTIMHEPLFTVASGSLGSKAQIVCPDLTCSIATFEIWQYERRPINLKLMFSNSRVPHSFSKKWLRPTDPFPWGCSSGKELRDQHIINTNLSANFQWIDEWHPDRFNRDADSDGWQYSGGFYETLGFKWSKEYKGAFHFVRKRRWVRHASAPYGAPLSPTTLALSGAQKAIGVDGLQKKMIELTELRHSLISIKEQVEAQNLQDRPTWQAIRRRMWMRESLWEWSDRFCIIDLREVATGELEHFLRTVVRQMQHSELSTPFSDLLPEEQSNLIDYMAQLLREYLILH